MVQILTTKILIDFIEKNYKSVRHEKIEIGNDSSSDDDENNINPLDYHKIEQIKFLPEQLSDWFDLDNDQYYHIGSLQSFEPQNIDYDINISLFSSILTCIIPIFSLPNKSVQSDIIQKMILKLKKEAKKKFSEFEYRNKETSFTHTDLIDDLDNGNFGGNIIRYIADFLHINIFVLDIEEDQLIFGNIKNFVPYKKTIFILKFENNIFEPLFTKKTKYFSFKDDLIEIIIDNIKDIDDEIEIIKKENLDKYNVKPITMSFREKKALLDLRKKEHIYKVTQMRKEEERAVIKIQEENELKKNKKNEHDDSSSSDAESESNESESCESESSESSDNTDED